MEPEEFYAEATRWRSGLPNRLTDADKVLLDRVRDFCMGPQPDIGWMVGENIEALIALVRAEHSPQRVLQSIAIELEQMRNHRQIARLLSVS
jgi:hypothetical protein